MLDLGSSLSVSPKLGPKAPSLRSVRRLRRDGSGVDVLDSSLENLLFPVGEVKRLPDCKDSLVSLRRGPGRVDGGVTEYVLALFWICETEVLRPAFPLFDVLSLLEFCIGGFNGELTEAAKA